MVLAATFSYYSQTMKILFTALLRIVKSHVIGTLLLAVLSLGSVANAALAVGIGCEPAVMPLMQNMDQPLQQVGCCEEASNDDGCQLCHLAVYDRAANSPWLFIPFSDKAVFTAEPRRRSLNPAPLIRPPVIT